MKSGHPQRGDVDKETGLVYQAMFRGSPLWLTPDKFKARKELDRAWRIRNAKSIKRYHIRWMAVNRERYNKCIRNWRIRNIKRQRKLAAERQRTRRSTDPLFRLRCNLSRRMTLFIRGVGVTKRGTTLTLIGCPWNRLRQHIESKFKSGMTWFNYGEWHLDHKIPLAVAKTSSHMRRLFHYTNLQPLWAFENRAKSDKLTA